MNDRKQIEENAWKQLGASAYFLPNQNTGLGGGIGPDWDVIEGSQEKDYERP